MLLVAGCEDGPEQIFEPNEGNPGEQNGYQPKAPFVFDGTAGYDFEQADDSAGRARFCDEAENTTAVQQMVTRPIIPDVSLGGLPLWNASNTVVHADDLLGRPEDGKFCDPSGVYSNAFTWGPTFEIIVFFNEETRLVELLAATQQYLGTMPMSYTKADATQSAFTVRMKERLTLDGTELTQYASPSNQASRPNSWLNHAQINKMYRALRETYFNADPFDPSFDCVDSQICDIIYTGQDESIPQETLVVFQDSGLNFYFSPDGYLIELYIEPVRIAPFESAGQIVMTSGANVAPTYTTAAVGSCDLDLGVTPLTFAQFKDRCVDLDRTLDRASYNVWTMRDAVDIEFNGMTFSFLHPIAGGDLLENGERPADADTLFGINYTRTLTAPVAEFVPSTLAAAYKTNLEQQLKDWVLPGCPSAHPFCSFSLTVPAGIKTTPQRIGVIESDEGSFVDYAIKQVNDAFEALTPAQQAQVDPAVFVDVNLIHPFVKAVTSAFTAGKSDAVGSALRMETTEDLRWSIASASFKQGGLPYRVVVQYSLNFGAVTSVSVERGYNEIDTILNDTVNTVLDELGTPAPYYEIRMSQMEPAYHGYTLGGSPIEVTGFDRVLKTLTVKLKKDDGEFQWDDNGTPGNTADDKPNNDLPVTVTMKVPGTSREADQGGYTRQINGERYEFVPADGLNLYGKETQLVVYVDADGAIGYIEQLSFKGAIELCDGLDVRFDDDVRRLVDEWSEGVTLAQYRDCDLAFNYSLNGNVLLSVASLSNKIRIDVTAGRAQDAAIWR
jgi:hypothetical protein